MDKQMPEEKGQALLEISDLYVQYRTDEAIVHALNGFTLNMNRSEKLGVVGETGAGKTTMALSVLRLLPASVGEVTQGSIVFHGEDLLAASKGQMLALRGKHIAMIFQDPMSSLNPMQTVGAQIMEVLNLHFPEMSRKARDERVDEIMNLVGIPPSRKKDYPHQFSGGMKQRIVIAIALIAEPELLIADEPTTALDVTIQAQILELMKRLKDKLNSGVILITHSLGVVSEFCDKVAVVYAGEVIEHGEVEQVYSRKRNHPYTAGLFQSIPDLYTVTDRLTPIPGFMVDPTNLPIGCNFSPRCRYAMEICRRENPPMYFVDGHGIKCHLFSEKGDAQDEAAAD